MELALMTPSGSKSTKSLEVPDATFAVEFNEGLVHQAVTAYMAGARLGTKAQKTRAEVRGGGRKPWAQKGTGNARAGTIRSPIWRSGGRTFAARPRDYSQKLNRKMYRGAMRCIVSELLRDGRMQVISALKLDSMKTKELVAKLNTMELNDVLIVVEEADENLILAARNLHWVAVVESRDLNPVSLMAFKSVLMTSSAMTKLGERLQ
jgi:large subunit ribosomal protein L4